MITFADKYLHWHYREYPSSHYRVHQIVHQHLIPVFGLTPLGAIERQAVEQYKHRRAGAAPTTVAKELRTLQALMNKAVEWGMISRNQLVGIQPPQDTRDAPPPFYQKDEIKLIYVCSLDPIKAATWQLLFNTGMRRAEALMLRREWIDAKGIKILSSREQRTKSKRWRFVPHNTGTKKALEVLRELDGQKVLPPVHPYSLSRAFGNCVRRAELNGSLHWTRHTYASHLVMSGTPLRLVQQLLGHSTIQTTEQYAHLAPDYMERLRIAPL